VPVGATLVHERIAATVRPGDHGSTFGGGPLAMAAVIATLDELVEADLMPGAERLFDALHEHLMPLDGVVVVRGRGGLVGVELDRPAKPVVAALRGEGILVGSSNEPHTLRLLPPLTMPLDGVDTLASALSTLLA
jgi:acetylornithine/succinyldiaminopimelate/putrescine aminotransferase